MTLTLVGLSHHVAPVELRERVAPTSAAAALAGSLGDAVCLSTQPHRVVFRRRRRAREW